MLYMVGSSVQIFSVIMLGMAFWQPLKAILDVNKFVVFFIDRKLIFVKDIRAI
jgi:hypothetical protein